MEVVEGSGEEGDSEEVGEAKVRKYFFLHLVFFCRGKSKQQSKGSSAYLGSLSYRAFPFSASPSLPSLTCASPLLRPNAGLISFHLLILLPAAAAAALLILVVAAALLMLVVAAALLMLVVAAALLMLVAAPAVLEVAAAAAVLKEASGFLPPAAAPLFLPSAPALLSTCFLLRFLLRQLFFQRPPSSPAYLSPPAKFRARLSKSLIFQQEFAFLLIILRWL